MIAETLQPLRSYLGTVKYGMRIAGSLFGKFPRECTVCGFKGRFLAFDNPIHLGLNINSRCPRCRGLERHRLIALCDREKNLFEGKELLHFAPEPGMRSYILKRKPKRYVTCDYAPDIADLRINIEKIDIADNAFDIVYCSHVLEHVDDSRAIPGALPDRAARRRCTDHGATDRRMGSHLHRRLEDQKRDPTRFSTSTRKIISGCSDTTSAIV